MYVYLPVSQKFEVLPNFNVPDEATCLGALADNLEQDLNSEPTSLLSQNVTAFGQMWSTYLTPIHSILCQLESGSGQFPLTTGCLRHL